MPTATIVGSRKAPYTVVKWFAQISEALLRAGWTCRSGLCPEGIDFSLTSAVIELLHEEVEVKAELYIAWNGFDGYRDGDLGGTVISAKKLPCYEKAVSLAKGVHPKWEYLTNGGKLLHSRNPFQVLGKDLESPSDVVLLWAPTAGASVTGGTRTAFEIARASGIPIYNGKNPDEVEDYLKSIGFDIPRHSEEPLTQDDLEI